MSDLNEAMKIKEKKAKIRNGIIALIIFTILLFIGNIVVQKLNGKNKKTNFYEVQGEILTACDVYPKVLLQIEKREDGFYGVVINDGEKSSEKLLSTEKLDEIDDFSIRLNEYNNDRNKDFVYIHSKGESGYNYRFYTIDKNYQILEIGLPDISLNLNKASVNLVKTKDGYSYNSKLFYYDGYKVNSEVGEYKLLEKTDKNLKKISKNSKISIDGRYKAIPRKVEELKEFPEYLQNVNEYMKNIENKKCILTDLDGDEKNEYIVILIENGNKNISLHDDSYNFLVNLYNGNNLNANLEIADVDNDGIMELITVDNLDIKVNRYNNGYFY